MKTKYKALTETTPRHELHVLDEMDRLFDAMTSRNWLHPFREWWPEWPHVEENMDLRVPRIDMLDREDEILVKAEVPDVDKKDLDIDVVGTTLTIRGERRREEKVDKDNFFRAEIATGSFARTLRLPEEIDPDKVTAELTNGVLEVHLPKTHTTPRKRVEIT